MFKEKLMAVGFTEKQVKVIESLVFDWGLTYVDSGSFEREGYAEFLSSKYCVYLSFENISALMKNGIELQTCSKIREKGPTFIFWAIH